MSVRYIRRNWTLHSALKMRKQCNKYFMYLCTYIRLPLRLKINFFLQFKFLKTLGIFFTKKFVKL